LSRRARRPCWLHWAATGPATGPVTGPVTGPALGHWARGAARCMSKRFCSPPRSARRWAPPLRGARRRCWALSQSAETQRQGVRLRAPSCACLSWLQIPGFTQGRLPGSSKLAQWSASRA